ncbi:glycoside hydrolase family 76 protein [Saccharopolyspora gloriosae]|uniref:glycoside hydrolase family 76 protein n=1 Tax=Saccharopolyspora gloriosae TaxID=455344 RepID=UPI001FB5D6F8|nr:glycoside hydrolase family 76 protein [Saccharopolyspora gloriosae]
MSGFRGRVLGALIGLLLCVPVVPAAAAPPDEEAGGRGAAAATALMTRYREDTGLFDTGSWWTSANALTALIGNMRVTGLRDHEYAIARTYDLNKDAQGGNFTNEYLDDTGWWGLAWIAAYDLTGDGRYLDTARADAEHMAAHWTSECGGGVLWNQHKTYKNAITNELYLWLNSALHNRIPGDSTHLQRARDEWAWFNASGMINSDGLVNDGLTEGCANNGDTTWTYNQGVLLGGLAELHRATGEQELLDRAGSLAEASTGSDHLNPDGILREPVEADDCFGDGASFKGAYVRGLGALNEALADRPHTDYLARQADAAYANDRDELDDYGPHWNGPWVAPGEGHGCQHSALDLLNAAPQG